VQRALKYLSQGMTTSIISGMEVKVFSIIRAAILSSLSAVSFVATAPPSDLPKATVNRGRR